MPEAPRVYVPAPRPFAAPAAAGAAPDALAGLNPAQREAVLHGDGPLLVVAGAGTGKTRTLVHRVAHLVARGAAPERVLLLTFTRRAAQEMLARAERLCGAAGRRVHGGTFHGTAHRLLRRFGGAAGVAPNFTVLDRGDAEDLMQLSRAALGHGDARPARGGSAAAGAGREARRFPTKETLARLYSRHVNTGRAVAALLADEYPQFAERAADVLAVFRDYAERKAERNLVDYDDLLLFWAAMLEASPALGRQIAGLYDHVLVDEYQDTNALQARVLAGLCRGPEHGGHRNVTAVGDDAQSIYGFRGAHHGNILDFPQQFPGTRVVALEENYRSRQPVLDAANAVMAAAARRYDKTLFTRRGGAERPWLVSCRDAGAEARFVADRVLELLDGGLALRAQAVLFRAASHSAELEVELTARGVPFEKWGGLKFLEAAHVKDVLAFLRVLENPRDEVSWYRVLLLLPGVGEATARAAVAHLAGHGWDGGALGAFAPPPRARDWHARLAALLAECRAVASGDAPGAEVARVRAVYDELLRERYDDAEPRLADLAQLEAIAAAHATRGAFLAALALEPPASTQDLAPGAPPNADDDVLVLSTIHSAKGKEWDAVCVIGAADGAFPSARAAWRPDDLEEERRLLYVALTRARDTLCVTWPVNSYASRWGAEYAMGQLSRFLTPEVQALFERVTPAADVDAAPGAEPVAPEAAGGLDLRALLRGRFGG
jgi:DNA helicase-2/ATP-dependent DNA helicase PcrA